MASPILHMFSGFMSILNRGLAWVDFGVHYFSGYLLYYVFRGLKPQTHTIPRVQNGRVYSPSVVVTGASEGIGLAIALRLAVGGYNVFATVKDETEIRKVKDAAYDVESKIMAAHGDLHVTTMDVLSQESISDCANYISTVLDGDAEKPLVGVINNAGLCMISPMELTKDEDTRRLFELDFFAYIAAIHAFLPIIKLNKGRFINIGSFGGYANVPLWAPYCAVKAAVEGLTRAWRFELMPFGVGMTSVRPGWTRTAGIGPKLHSAWESYYDSLDKGAVGVDSMGATMMARKEPGNAEEKVYRPIIDKWHTLTVAAAEGVAQPSEAVAETVHDALTDRFLMPYYTVGYDGLLGQMARDLAPESIWEYSVAKSFGCL